MKAWWQLFEKVIAPAECAEIVRLGLSLGPQEATVGHGGGAHVDASIRVSQTAWIRRWEPLMMPLFDRLYVMGKQANAYVYGLNLDNFYEVQFTVYDGDHQGCYHKHIDNCWVPTDLARERMFERKMSMVVQLSAPDDYIGGRLQLTKDPLPDNLFLNRGDVIFFPSWNEHAVTPVTAGIRYSLVSWFMGPKMC